MKVVEQCVWIKRGYNPGVASDHMYNAMEFFLIAYHDKAGGTNKKQPWQANFARDDKHYEALARNVKIQNAIELCEGTEDLDDAITELCEEEPTELDEHYEAVRSRTFTFEAPADKLKNGEGKV